MNEKIFLPEKITVGYQKRSDTYTKSLGYVIYTDKKVEIELNDLAQQI